MLRRSRQIWTKCEEDQTFSEVSPIIDPDLGAKLITEMQISVRERERERERERDDSRVVISTNGNPVRLSYQPM